MALSPGIPTSFVPKQPVQPTRRPMHSGTNLFLIVALIVAGIVVAVAIGTFAYNKYLQQTLAGKQARLAQAQSQVDENTVEDFVRLRDRLATSKGLLTDHIVASHFFDALEAVTLQNVRFNSLTLSIAGDHSAQLQMAGTAKSFNALAAQSNAFAGEKRIKRAIFSDITVTKDNQVSFKMTGDIDSKLLIAGTAAPLQAPVQTAPTAPAAPTAPTPSSAGPAASLPAAGATSASRTTKSTALKPGASASSTVITLPK